MAFLCIMLRTFLSLSLCESISHCCSRAVLRVAAPTITQTHTHLPSLPQYSALTHEYIHIFEERCRATWHKSHPRSPKCAQRCTKTHTHTNTFIYSRNTVQPGLIKHGTAHVQYVSFDSQGDLEQMNNIATLSPTKCVFALPNTRKCDVLMLQRCHRKYPVVDVSE